MKKILLLFIVLVTINSQAQTSLYENPKFDEIAKNHKSLGILPFKTTVELRKKDMEKMSKGELSKLEKKESESIQLSMYSWFLKRKKQGKMQTIEVQDPNTTKALLRKKNITEKNMNKYTPKQLANILNVDAVITGDYKTTKPMSEGASLALGLLSGLWGSTNTATINMSVHNRKDGVLLWNYNKKVRGSIGTDSDDLINTLMRKASRRLSYTKKK